MTDNRATELLRKLLDERGEDYSTAPDGFTTWWHDTGEITAWEDSDGVLTVWGITSEQAVNATLGDSRAERITDDEWERYQHSVPATDENMAKFGWVRERTCKQEERGWGTEGDHARVWLTCGHDCMVPTVQDLPNYCPNCGARVVE